MNTPQMYEVYLERTAERDLKKLSAETSHRVIPHIHALAEIPRPPDPQDVTKSQVRIMIGGFGLEIIASSMRLMTLKRQ